MSLKRVTYDASRCGFAGLLRRWDLLSAWWGLLFRPPLAGAYWIKFMNKLKLIKSSANSAAFTILFVTILTIWAEFSMPLKDWLKSISGHHWTTKSIFSAIFFLATLIVFYLVNRSSSPESVKKSLYSLITIAVVGVLALTLFFTGHHLKIF